MHVSLVQQVTTYKLSLSWYFSFRILTNKEEVYWRFNRKRWAPHPQTQNILNVATRTERAPLQHDSARGGKCITFRCRKWSWNASWKCCRSGYANTAVTQTHHISCILAVYKTNVKKWVCDAYGRKIFASYRIQHSSMPPVVVQHFLYILWMMYDRACWQIPFYSNIQLSLIAMDQSDNCVSVTFM